MVAADTTRAAVISGLAGAILMHADGLALIYLTAFITGAGSALRGTARGLRQPGPGERSADSRADGRQRASRTSGCSAWRQSCRSRVSAGALGLAALLLLTLPGIVQPAGQSAQRDAARTGATVRQDLAEGLAWLRRHSEIRDLTLAVGVISAMDAACFAVLVLYVIQILHQQPGAYGVLLAVGAVGGIAAGPIGSRLTRRLGRWPVLLLAGLGLAASQLVLGLAANVLTAALMLVANSAALALFSMTTATMRQRLVPDGLLGRVTSLYGTVSGGAGAVGALAGGALATAAGIRATMMVGAIPMAAVTIVMRGDTGQLDWLPFRPSVMHRNPHWTPSSMTSGLS